MAKRPQRISYPGADYEVHVHGIPRAPLHDFYHALLRHPWWVLVASIAITFLATNALFALGYLLSGGLANAQPGSFLDAFYFSVQTMGTIGYGAVHPITDAANALVVLEAIVGLTMTAVWTGLVFAKFSRSTARVRFTQQVVIGPVDGVPTLTFRISNERGNQIVNAHIRIVLNRTERTLEGHTRYRSIDLTLLRDHVNTLSRAFVVQHPITRDSPLFGVTPASWKTLEIEMNILVVGLDDTTGQTVHATHNYHESAVRWGSRHVDLLSETPDGHVLLDLTKFDDREPTKPTADFPYP